MTEPIVANESRAIVRISDNRQVIELPKGM